MQVFLVDAYEIVVISAEHAQTLGMESNITPAHLLRLWPGATHAEIADKLEVAPGTVSAWFSRGEMSERGQLLVQVKYPKALAAVLAQAVSRSA